MSSSDRYNIALAKKAKHEVNVCVQISNDFLVDLFVNKCLSVH